CRYGQRLPHGVPSRGASMDRMIFVNLPVRDVQLARGFYTGPGFTVNEMFSDEQCACIVVSDTIFVMIMDHARFTDFVTKEVVEARRSTGVINCLSAASGEGVDSLSAAAVAHGGVEGRFVSEGPMYGRAFSDPDGHA